MEIVINPDFIITTFITFGAGKVFWSRSVIRWIVGFLLFYAVLQVVVNIPSYSPCLIAFFIPLLLKINLHHYLLYFFQSGLSGIIRIPSLIFSGFGRSSERYSGRYEDMYEDTSSSSRNDNSRDSFDAEREAWKRKEEKKEAEFQQREQRFQEERRKFEEERKKSQKSTPQTMSYEVALNLLGLREPFNQRELKKAFRSTSNQYHPDKNIGATEAVKKMAEEKMKEVLQAQRIISNRKGW